MYTKPRIVFFGTPALAVPVLESLIKEFEVIGVVSQPDKPVGKGGQVTPSPVSQFALEQGLTLQRPAKLKEETFQNQFKLLEFDVAVVLAYGKILPQWILDTPKHGAINIHASILPLHRGASPIVASILAGDTETGISYMVMNSKMDEGDIILQSKMSIDSDETTKSLSIKLSQSASKDINDVVKRYLAGDLDPVQQAHDQATYTKLLTKGDGQINFEQPPVNLERMIRAYHPWPGVWGVWNGKRVKLLPGRMVQMEGKKVSTLADFKHGYPDFPLPAA